MRARAIARVLSTAFCLCLSAGLLGLLFDVEDAHAAPVSASVADGEVGVSTGLGTITLYFGNNVAAGAVFAANAAHISLTDEYGSLVAGSGSVYRLYYGEGAPDGDNPDDGMQRQYLYLQVPPLQPGTTYYLSVTPGIMSIGNHVYDGLYAAFTTAGEKPVEEPPDPPPPPPDPVPVVPDGGGGSGGMAGSDSTGGGLDQSGANGSGASTGTSPDASSEAVAAPEEAAVESSAKDGESRAAGLGGGVLYTIGAAGLDTGKATDAVPVEVPELTWQFVLTLGLIAVCLALLGAGKRAVAWRRRTAH